jgi:hypothetical protein
MFPWGQLDSHLSRIFPLKQLSEMLGCVLETLLDVELALEFSLSEPLSEFSTSFSELRGIICDDKPTDGGRLHDQIAIVLDAVRVGGV